MSTDCKLEETKELEKPEFLKSNEWRLKNGFITPEWQMYRDAITKEAIVFMIISFAAGVVTGISFFVR